MEGPGIVGNGTAFRAGGASEAGLEEWIDFVIERLVSVPPPSMEDVEKTEPGEVAKSSL